MKDDRIYSYEEYKKINEKKKDQTYSSGCIMGYFDVQPESLYKQFFDIEETDIFNNEENEYGLEIEPHCTILYGLHDDEIEEEEVIQLLNLIKMPVVNFDKITLFENEKFDVLKWDLDPTQLQVINKIVDNTFPNTQSFPDYHPHCTIAYLNPGSGKSYVREDIESFTVPVTKWVYSKANGRKIAIYPDGHVEILREAKDDTETTYVESYKDYTICYTINEKFDDMYTFRVYKNYSYKMGIKGATSLIDGMTSCKRYIDNCNE